MIVNREVGVFPHVNRAHALVDAELHGGIQGDHLERFVVREAAKLHALGGFLIQVRGFFGVVGIDGDDHAAAGHQRRVVRNRIIGFHFVGPPIGKSGSANSGGSQFIGDFIPFKNVLKGADFEAELFRNAEEHQDFILPVAV